MFVRAIRVITSLQVYVCVSVISGRMRVIPRRRSIGILIILKVSIVEPYILVLSCIKFFRRGDLHPQSLTLSAGKASDR